MALKLKYKGGKPIFRCNGSLSYLIFYDDFLRDDDNEVSVFTQKFIEKLSGKMERILDEYEELIPFADDWIAIVCEVEGYNGPFLKRYFKTFRGSCEIEIEGVIIDLHDPDAAYCWVQLIARNVVVDCS